MLKLLQQFVTYYAIYFCFITSIFMQPSCTSIPAIGNCTAKFPEVLVDVRKVTGLWYELERWPSLQEWPYKCISIKVSHFFEMKSEVTWTSVHRFTAKRAEKTLPIKMASDANDGKLTVGPSEFATNPKDTSVQILSTDYNNWALVWSCNVYIGDKAHSEMVWIFTRQRDPSEETISKIEAALVNLHLEHRRLIEVPQTECDNVKENKEDASGILV